MAINLNFHQSNEQLQEELIIIEAAKINPNQFAPLYIKYYEQIFNYIYNRMASKDVAFDITSQVFLKAMTNLSKYIYMGVPFSSWLFRIAHNELMQVFRTNKTHRMVNADISDLHFICEETHELFFEEYIPIIKKLILKLKSNDLQLVEMRFFEKRPYKEIAEILNITEVNAKVKMFRILEKLKIELAKYKTSYENRV
jgi:RNA polymerase sigma-70 factor (ECF subfamily)